MRTRSPFRTVLSHVGASQFLCGTHSPARSAGFIPHQVPLTERAFVAIGTLVSIKEEADLSPRSLPPNRIVPKSRCARADSSPNRGIHPASSSATLRRRGRFFLLKIPTSSTGERRRFWRDLRFPSGLELKYVPPIVPNAGSCLDGDFGLIAQTEERIFPAT